MGLGVAVIVQGGILRAFGLYRGVWVLAGLPDLLRITRAVAVAAVVTPLVVVVAVRCDPGVPRLVLLLQPLLLAIYAGACALAPHWKEFHLYGALRALGQPVWIVLGGGDAAMSAGARVVTLRRVEGGGATR